MIYFTSDMHFGHKNVIQMCNRPFENIDSMDNKMICNWNSVIKDNDEVYVLGDLTLNRNWKVATNYLKELRGQKYLIKGNHDKYLFDEHFDRRQYKLIAPYYEVDCTGRKFVLFHYPIADWNGKFRGSIHLHGHIHSLHWSALQENLGNVYDVGVDANEFMPVPADLIIERCSKNDGLGFVNEYVTGRKLSLTENEDERYD